MIWISVGLAVGSLGCDATIAGGLRLWELLGLGALGFSKIGVWDHFAFGGF